MLKRTNRATLIFSPSLLIYDLTSSSTVIFGSRMYGCWRSSLVLTSLLMRPSTIFSTMFSGLPCKSSLAASIFFSFSSHAASISSSRTHVTEGDAATCMAMAFASSWNSGRLATKSVSQLTSTITPSFEPVWMYVSMIPSLAARPAFLSAEARPFWRSISVALSMSPSCSSSAFLQSIIPAPVMSRRVFTVLASTVACIATSARPAGTRDRDTTAPEARRTAAAGARKAKRAARSSGEARIGAAWRRSMPRQ
mmetsp:Transcript_2275/g.5688  ORF Transcript_2275/g.5688 Transcript_2275/m.5688 type:complete len:252 (-) Transcript_2275:5-760(-)